MARAQDESSSLRFGRRESARVAAAVLLSILVHLSVVGSIVIGNKLGLWHKFELPRWLLPATKKYELQALLGHNSEPDIFVDVSHADADAPTRTQYYSSKNSRASNPNPDDLSANVPKIEGTQKNVPKTEDAPRPVPKVEPQPPTPPTPPAPKEPAPEPPKEAPKEAPKEPAKEAPKPDNTPQLPKLEPSMPPPSLPPPQLKPLDTPETPPPPGETDQRKPQKVAPPTQNTAVAQAQQQPPRPRTIKQALGQQSQLPGAQMQQPGGVVRRTLWPSLDAKSTPFGEYDRAIIEAVSQRWYDLLDSRRFAQERDGKVILRFKLKPDGTIIEMQTLENTVGELLGYLCQEAVEEAAPFAKWPPDMIRMIGTNYRDITFTFYYY